MYLYYVKNTTMSRDEKEASGVIVKEEVIDVDQDNEGGESVDGEQLEEYREKVLELGRFADKVSINSLSMIAEDYAESEKSAAAIYNCIREPLMSSSVSSDRKLPLVYVIDSILKNVRGSFIPVIEKDAKNWIPIVYAVLNEENRARLKKVWNTWKEFNVFHDDSWKEMGRCFTSNETAGIKVISGILRSKDGSLQLPPRLRREMQNVLDELQSDVTNELEKVSLERLADINPDLLVNIKKTAEDVLRGGSNGAPDDHEGRGAMLALFEETRSPSTLQRSKDWEKLNLDYAKQAQDLIAKLQLSAQDGTSQQEKYSFPEAVDMTNALAAAAATSVLLSSALERLKNQDDNKENALAFLQPNSGNLYQSVGGRGFLTVDKSQFSNEGVKKKNDAVIASLYGVGLPFVSSSDGRRFASQFELSSHLDALFKKSQVEKSMAKTEERGWYVPDARWTGELTISETTTGLGNDPSQAGVSSSDDDADPSTYTVPADESRDRCVICGINFKMFFDNDDGIYKYSNCREIEVLNDDVAEVESELALVHVTCWRGLGSPPFLSMDQALQEARHY